jgi:hypothetical protein
MRWDEELDALGNAADDSSSFGECKRNAQLLDAPAIDLDGVNQYGVITNSYDFSGDDVTVSGYVIADDITGTKVILSQTFTSTNYWLCIAGSKWASHASLAWRYWDGLSAPIAGKEYYFELSNTGTSNTLSVTNLTDGITETQTKIFARNATSGDFYIGSNRAGTANFFNGQIWGLKLDHANGFELPMAEGSGSVSYDVSGNGNDCTWQNSPSWGSQSQYFWNENQGCDVVGTFDGVDDYVTTGTSGLITSKPTACCGWVNFSGGTPGTFTYPFGAYTGGSTRTLGFMIGATTDQIWLVYDGSTPNNFIVSGMWTGWHHLAITFDNSTNEIIAYLDGSEIKRTSDVETSATSYDVGIGARAGGNNPVKQLAADVRFYDTHLTADNVTHIYTFGASGTDPSANLVAKYNLDENEGLIAADSSGNGNDGTVSGATADEFWGGPIIPAASDGTSLIRATPSNPAGPWLYEGLGDTYVNFDVVPNANQWLEQRWQEAEFDGVSSKIELPNLLSIDRDVEVRLKFKADAWTSNQTLFCCNNGSSNRIGIVSHGGNIRVFFYDGTIALKASETATIGEEHEVYVKYKASTYELISATLDGVEMSGVATASVNSSTGSFLGINSTGAVWGSVGFYEGSIRGLVLHDNGVKVLDMPLLGASLDLSQVNHGTDTDVVYNRLTDLSYTAGDTVEQPFSANDATAGRVSELVQFTFPVTTLSNTPTISQTVYEDGNTITEDSLPIYES